MQSWEHEEIMEGKIIVEGHSAPILTVSYQNKRIVKHDKP